MALLLAGGALTADTLAVLLCVTLATESDAGRESDSTYRDGISGI
jgi:hypothetical protein